MMEEINIGTCGRRGAVEMTLCGKPLRAFPQSLEIASRFPHSHRLDDCYTLSEFKLRKESSRTAFPNPSGSSFDWKRLEVA
jgi:hypothetical protein